MPFLRALCQLGTGRPRGDRGTRNVQVVHVARWASTCSSWDLYRATAKLAGVVRISAGGRGDSRATVLDLMLSQSAGSLMAFQISSRSSRANAPGRSIAWPFCGVAGDSERERTVRNRRSNIDKTKWCR